MKIEITEKGSEAFYRETVNVSAQYRYLLKNHSYRLRDYFRQFTLLLILGAVFLVLLLVLALSRGLEPWDYAVIGLLGTAVVLCAAYLYLLHKMLRAMLADSRTSVLTLDDTGVELNKGGSQIVKLGWDNVAMVRVFRESLVFVSGDRTGIVISAAKRYADQILSWLRANQPGLELVEESK